MPRTKIIHCQHCGADNEVESDVVGKLCNNCGEAIYAPELETESKAKRVMADRTRDVLRVVCPVPE